MKRYKMTSEQLSAFLEALRLTNPSLTRAERFREALTKAFGATPPIKYSSSALGRYFDAIGEGRTVKAHKSHDLSPYEQIRMHEKAILAAVAELDIERAQLSKRIIEIDNMVAKWTRNTK